MARGRPRKSKTDGDNGRESQGATTGYEAELWRMADALRGSMDSAEYKHVVLGLIFLKSISDAFEEMHARLEAEEAAGADPEDPDEYRAKNIFWVPPEARRARRSSPTSGRPIRDWRSSATSMIGAARVRPALGATIPTSAARRAPRRLAGQAVAAGYASGSRRQCPHEPIPQRIRVPLQPPPLP